MKFTTALLAVFVAAITMVSAQVPQGFTYQSVLRDASGIPVANEAGISLTFTIIIDGGNVYSESLTSSTNDFGLINETVGLVSPSAFAAIDWSTGTSFQLKADVTYTGGNITKTNDLYTVPFAMIAANPGLPGPTGPAGADGADGAQGPTGPAGADGTNGTNGADGADGATGPQGPAGPAGANGADGADGADGLLPDGTDTWAVPYWDNTQWQVGGSGFDYDGTNVGLVNNQLRVRDVGDGNHFLQYSNFNGTDGPELVGLSSVKLRQITGGSVGQLVLRNNRVGINTDNPTNGLLHVNGWYTQNSGGFWFYANGGCCGGASGGVDVSIFASNRIHASEFNAFSDARIKNIEGISNSTEDLNTIMGIEITDYNKIDQAVNKGTEKKVIAQQVETVYPQAVSKTVDVVPDIYKLADISNGMIEVANELETGNKVRLIFEDRTVMAEVLSANADGFSVDLADEGQVFVYGTEVDDFRTVDYEAISMLNVSATQELFKMITSQQELIDAMNSQMGDLRSQLESNHDLILEMKGILGISSTNAPQK